MGMKRLLKNGEPVGSQDLAKNMDPVRDAGCRTTHQFIDLVERRGRIEAAGDIYTYEDPSTVDKSEYE